MKTLKTKLVYRVFFGKERKKRAATAVDNSHKKETHNTTTTAKNWYFKQTSSLFCGWEKELTVQGRCWLLLAKYLIMYEYSSTRKCFAILGQELFFKVLALIKQTRLFVVNFPYPQFLNDDWMMMWNKLWSKLGGRVGTSTISIRDFLESCFDRNIVGNFNLR